MGRQLNRDILEGKDQHSQHEKADSLNVGTDFVYIFDHLSVPSVPDANEPERRYFQIAVSKFALLHFLSSLL